MVVRMVTVMMIMIIRIRTILILMIIIMNNYDKNN
jgi:hypothetical protein